MWYKPKTKNYKLQSTKMRRKRIQLPNSTIFTEEMNVIGKAILIAYRNKKDTVIYTDPLASINAIDNKKPSRRFYINYLKVIINTTATNIIV